MTPQTPVVSAADNWLRMSLALAFVIGLIFLSAWLVRKMARGGLWEQPVLSGQIRVLAKVPLGEKRYLMVVALASKTLLLGMTPQSINLICELDAFDPGEQPKEKLFERIFRAAGSRKPGEPS